MSFIEQDRKKYATILSSDGKVHVTSTENDSLAVKREYENKDKQKAIKYERVYNGLKGMINNIEFYEGDFGKMINVSIADDGDEENTILSMSLATNFADDFMKKLPNINLAEPITLIPYAFTADNGKDKKGVTILQQGRKKILNFFYDPITKVNINGFPTPEGDRKTYDKDMWKIYFMQCRKFLQNYIETNILPKLGGVSQAEEADNAYTPEDIEPVAAATPANFPAAMTTDELLKEINNLAVTKLGAKNAEEVKQLVMEKTNLAFIEPNLPSILEALKR
jgi:hypothetical protein